MNVELSTQILFYWPVSDLTDRLRMITGMQARTLETKERIDEYIYTDDTDWLHRTLKKAFSEAYTYVWKLSTNLNYGLLLNISISVAETEEYTATNQDSVPVSITGVPSYGFWVKNLQGHNKHSLLMIDNKIIDLVTEMVIRDWWLKCGLADLYKNSSQTVTGYKISLNNSLMDLYKVKMTFSNTASIIDVDVDEEGTETNSEDEETTTPDTSGDYEILYFDTYAQFPATGTSDKVYIDRATGNMYYWNGEYTQYFTTAAEYELTYEDSNYVVVSHNLGKFAPNVTVLDEDGNDFVVDIEYVDVDSLIVSWNTACSGKIICN